MKAKDLAKILMKTPDAVVGIVDYSGFDSLVVPVESAENIKKGTANKYSETIRCRGFGVCLLNGKQVTKTDIVVLLA